MECCAARPSAAPAGRANFKLSPRRHSGQRVPAGSQPRGAGALLSVEESYVAASGRPCRRLTVTLGEGVRQVLTCRASETRWAEVRALN
ncbi:DVU3141 family protein [Halomonas sp. E19]|uniref:DVU3141 family protein n=1 Tax=Halomonas sp. E19 TaxID=3397247 RepID=UPI004034685F